MSTAIESPPTAKQMAVLRLIYETARDRGYQPSFREVVRDLGLAPSTNAIMCHLKALVRKGYLAWPDRKARRIVILKRPDGSSFSGFADKEPTP